jgi:hypothetical protein
MKVGKRYSLKIKYRFQVFVPKRQILRCSSNAVFRSALTCLSVPFTFFYFGRTRATPAAITCRIVPGD